MAMNMNEIRNTARQMTIEALIEVLMENEAIKFADGSFAILQNVEGQEVWTEVTIKSKNWKDTKVSKAFNPRKAAEAWEEEKRISAANKALKAKEKEAKIKKDKEKREEA